MSYTVKEHTYTASEQKSFHTDKLTLLGLLGTGISHEINTPSQFIGDNLRFVQSSLNDLFKIPRELIKTTETYLEAHPDKALADQIKAIKDKAGLDFLEEEIQQAVEDSLQGLERVSTMVHAISEYSYNPRETNIKRAFNMNRLLENALNITTNEWKYNVTIEKDLDPSLPAFACDQKEIQLAFLHLILNAADAIKAHPTNKGAGTISLQTEYDEGFVTLKIKDNGIGIPEDSFDKIFLTSFTTKDCLEQSGHGLPIVYFSIIEQHQGTIEFSSTVNEGSLFTIKIPISKVATNTK